MKTVFSSPTDVIHLFAQRSQDNAKCSNVFFDGNKIYSYGYHFLMGEFITNKNGDIAIMINDSRYSATTSKHVAYLSSATRQYKQFFTRYCDSRQVLQQLESILQKLGNAKKPQKYINEALNVLNHFNEFLLWFGKPYDSFSQENLKKIRKIEKLFNSTPGKESAEQYAKKKAAAQKAADKKDFLKSLQKFNDFEINYISHNSFNKEDFLRINKQSGNVETSQGVRVPIKEAQTLYKLIKTGKDIKGFKISNYTVISLNGVLQVGCHRINRKNMQEIGEQIINL